MLTQRATRVPNQQTLNRHRKASLLPIKSRKPEASAPFFARNSCPISWKVPAGPASTECLEMHGSGGYEQAKNQPADRVG
jgi:hypothetical protein